MEKLLIELEDCIPSPVTVERRIEGKELTRLLNMWLASLPDDDRILFVRRYWNGEILNELAAEYRVPLGNMAKQFSCFDSEEYPYCDVLEIVYQIDSADAISEIVVKPARMDNTDGGKAIQEKIGTYVITDREEIDTIYQILSSLTCYGSNRWDMIDYGDVEAPADAKISSHQAVLLGRYLSIVTDYGNEIDGLKYTAVSDMFYEFSGIAYNRLSTEQAERVSEIFRITENVEDLHNQTNEGSDKSSSANEHNNETLVEADNASVSLEYITELQSNVSNAMINGELPFVISSAVYENPYRLHIVVTSNSESDIQKLLELDSVGGTLEIEYAPANTNCLELYLYEGQNKPQQLMVK